MESWRQCFRDGFLPLLSTEEIVASRELLAADSKRLIQGSTTTPPPLMCVKDWPVECGLLPGQHRRHAVGRLLPGRSAKRGHG
jgi:hypothetical protein